jgi:hypothetical protein
MAKGAKPSRAGPARKPVRPMLLAGGLGLIWFVQFQQGDMTQDAPSWGYGLVLGMRLLADFVGAWVAVALLQLAIALGRLGLVQLRSRPEEEM